MKQQINFRASDLTNRQLTDLIEHTGLNQTEVIAMAVDRMFREEIKMATKTVEDQARERISEMDFSTEQEEFIFADWPNWDEHIQWLLTASKAEIENWIKAGQE